VIESDIAAPPKRIARLRDTLAGWAAAAPWPRISVWLAVIVFFTVAAIVQTWPLAKHLDDSLSVWHFFPYDVWAFLWNLWWVKHALVELQTNPFHTDYLYTPQGSNLYLHPLTFVNGVLSLPLQLITGNLILSWNVLALIYLALSGIGGYLLTYRVTQNRLAGLLGGYIFAFAPYTLMRFGGHWNVFATWPIPFFMFFVLRLIDSRSWKDAVVAGVFLSIITYNWIEFAVDAGTVFAIFLAYWSAAHLLKGERQRLVSLWRGTAILAVVWIVLSAPVLLPTLQDGGSGDYYQPGREPGVDQRFSADLLAYVTPSPLWGPGKDPPIAGTNPDLQSFNGSIEGTAYLGILPLLLAGVAALSVLRRTNQVVPWLITFLAFALLALGPRLWVDSDNSFSILGVSFSVPLPYQLYDKLPFAGDRRAPVRMIVFGILALSVLSGIGLSVIMESLRHRWKMGLALLAAPVLALAVVASERWNASLSTAIPVVLAVIILLAVCGAAALLLLRRQQRPWMLVAPAVGFVAIALVALEYWGPPIALTPYSHPAVLDEIRKERGDFTVLEVPLGRRTGWTCAGDCTGAALVNYYQTLYQKPSTGGYISRVRDEGFDWFIQQPGLRYLSSTGFPQAPDGDDNDRRKVRETFEANNIKYVIVHKTDPAGGLISYVGQREIDIMDSYLRDIAGLEPFHSDSQMSIYRMRERP
jgi:hypothetical protein